MADDDVTVIEESPEPPFQFAEGWSDELQVQVAGLFQFQPDRVRGLDRMGALAFSRAPDSLVSIQAVLRDLAVEPFDELPPSFAADLSNKISEARTTLDAIVELTSDTDQAQLRRDQLEGELEQIDNWFCDEARRHTHRARYERFQHESPISSVAPDEIEALRDTLVHLRREMAEQTRELESRRDVINTIREGARESAGEDLSAEFTLKASNSRTEATGWLRALVASAVATAISATVVFLIVQPEQGANDARDIAALALGAFLVGLPVFSMRVCAQNFRVNRHLAAIAESRATAISTFRRLVASVEDEDVRSAVTLTLAQSVFATEETGLVDGSGDHVTLVERALLPRLGGGSPPASS